MKNIEFTVSINADAQKVWDSLWNKENYEQWAAVFKEGTYLDSYDLQEGNIVQFLGSEGNGMYALIEVLRPAQQMTFKHLGEIKEGKEYAFEIHGTKDLAGTESYLLVPQEMGIILNVEVVVPEDWVSFIEEKYPLALQKIKEIAES